MKKVQIVEQEIRLSSILALEIEVNGFVQRDEKGNPIYNIPGLMSQKLDAKTKYWLGKLSTKLTREKKNYDDLRVDLIKKYGEPMVEDNKNFNIPPKIKDPNFIAPLLKKGQKELEPPMVENPKLKEFQKEVRELLKQLVRIALPKFDIEELFSFQTEYSYVNSGELLIQDDSPEFKYEDLSYDHEEVID